MTGIDVVGADEGGLVGAAPEWLKKAGAAIIPAASSAATDALSDKPKDSAKPADKPAMEGESFFSKAIVGPVKVWHALLGAVAAGGGIYLWKR